MEKTCSHQKTVFAKRLFAALMVAVLLCAAAVPSFAAGGLELSTTYPGISVSAGEELSFSLDLSNASSSGCNVALSTVSLPEGWQGYFTGNGGQISHVYAKSGENTAVANFNVTVPSDAQQGTYEITLNASGGGMSSNLVLELVIDENSTVGASSLVTEYETQEGSASTSFSFNTTITNNTPNEQSYSLSAQAPSGWTVSFNPSGESTQVAAIDVPAYGSQGLTVAVSPPQNVEAGEYEIPISAISSSETLSSTLTVVITGTYDITLSTPSGLLSFDATSNKATDVTLTITNNGNVDLQNLNLTSSAPTDWTVTFSESSIDVLEAGSTKEVTATVTPAKDSLSGDYVMTITASGSETSSSAEFRVSVKTETIWGIVGLLAIAAAAAALSYVFRKYGRR